MDFFFENAQRIFDVDVARSGANEENHDFALLIRPDGGLHSSWNRHGVRVQGRNAGRDCVLEERSASRELLRNQALYRMTSPLLTAWAPSWTSAGGVDMGGTGVGGTEEGAAIDSAMCREYLGDLARIRPHSTCPT